MQNRIVSDVVGFFMSPLLAEGLKERGFIPFPRTLEDGEYGEKLREALLKKARTIAAQPDEALSSADMIEIVAIVEEMVRRRGWSLRVFRGLIEACRQEKGYAQGSFVDCMEGPDSGRPA